MHLLPSNILAAGNVIRKKAVYPNAPVCLILLLKISTHFQEAEMKEKNKRIFTVNFMWLKVAPGKQPDII